MSGQDLAARIRGYRDRFCFVDETCLLQLADGSYRRVYADPQTKERPLPVTEEAIWRHVRGEITLAFYTSKRVGQETLTREAVVESDGYRVRPDPSAPGRVRHDPINARSLIRDMHLRLAREGIPSALELSRRGARVRIFAQEPVSARAARSLALFGLGSEERVRMARGETAVEIFPKQDELKPGQVGNAVRGLFGIHRKSNERYPLIYPDGRPVATTLGGQLDYVLSVPAVDIMREVERRPWLEDERVGILDRAAEPARPRDQEREQTRPGGGPGRSPLDAWKREHPLEEVLARYGLHVTHSGNYHCVLNHHENGDQHPSLSVDLERGLWFCHKSQVGGSQVDFILAAEGLSSPREAFAYLRGRGEIEPPPPSGRDTPLDGRG